MTNRVTLYFEADELRKKFEAYSQQHGRSFSETVIEFARAGFNFFQKCGTLNVDLVLEKMKTLDEAKKEIDFLKKIIEANLLAKPDRGIDTSSLLDAEKGKDSLPSSADREPCRAGELRFGEHIKGKPLRRDPTSKNWDK